MKTIVPLRIKPKRILCKLGLHQWIYGQSRTLTNRGIKICKNCGKELKVENKNQMLTK